MARTSQIPDPRIVWPGGVSPASCVVFARNVIDIAAPPERVWSLLVDCAAWPRWYKNCSDVSILQGGPALDGTSQFRFKTLGMYFEPRIETCLPGRMLVWSAKGPAGTSGAHAWHIAPSPLGSVVVTEEAQRGLLLHLRRSHLRNQLLTVHEEWLQSLKRMAEAAWPF